jgi:hypothetical protein
VEVGADHDARHRLARGEERGRELDAFREERGDDPDDDRDEQVARRQAGLVGKPAARDDGDAGEREPQAVPYSPCQ